MGNDISRYFDHWFHSTVDNLCGKKVRRTGFKLAPGFKFGNTDCLWNSNIYQDLAHDLKKQQQNRLFTVRYDPQLSLVYFSLSIFSFHVRFQIRIPMV